MRPAVRLLAVLAATGVALACSSHDGRDTATPTSEVTDGPMSTPGEDPGEELFRTRCAACHGPEGEGNVAPPLVGIADRMTLADQVEVVTAGRATMPAFAPALSDDEIRAVVDYTRTRL